MVADPHSDDHGDMSRLVANLPTKSAKIRALDASGYSRSAIAAYLGIRYQHVRNVLGPLHQTRSEPDEPAEVAPYGGATVDDEGRIALPSEVLRALGLMPGSSFVWELEDSDVKLLGRKSGIRFAQDLVRKKLGDRSLTDELLEERRRQFEREEQR